MSIKTDRVEFLVTQDDFMELMEDNQKQAEVIESLTARVPQWISVEDRLPEENSAVVVFDGSGGSQPVYLCLFHRESHWPEKITHWMPLPPPPETSE